MKLFPFLNRRGISLIGVLVAIVIVTMCGLTFIQLFSSHRVLLGALDKKERAVQIANSTMGKMSREEFDSLVVLCRNKNILNVAQPVIGTCTSQGILNASPSGSTNLSDNPYQLEVLREWSGGNSSTGELCLELTQCQSLADNHLLDVSVSVFFRASAQRTESRTLTFRRTRW